MLLRPVFFLLLSALPLSAAQPTGAGGALDEFDSIQLLPPKGGQQRLVLGDAHGVLHVYQAREGAFTEVWASAYLEGAVSGVFVADVNADELEEMIAYTDKGRLHYLDIQDYALIWSNPPGEYSRITCLTIHQLDDDPQPELVFCADGRLVVYDGRDRYEQWRSDQTNLTARDILIGDVDGDGEEEIVLNDGYVFAARFFDLEWQSPEPFGERLGLLDVDADGIPELIGEFQGRFLRVFDIDLRREKSISPR